MGRNIVLFTNKLNACALRNEIDHGDLDMMSRIRMSKRAL